MVIRRDVLPVEVVAMDVVVLVPVDVPMLAQVVAGYVRVHVRECAIIQENKVWNRMNLLIAGDFSKKVFLR